MGVKILVGKKGWIRIVEAFVAVLLTAGVLLLVVGEEHLINPNPDSEIYDSQLLILRDIQRNTELRQSVLDATTPVESDESEFPPDVKIRIEYLSPDYLECEAKICGIGLNCDLEELPEKSVYVQTAAITATLTTYNPKQLKLFCWRK